MKSFYCLAVEVKVAKETEDRKTKETTFVGVMFGEATDLRMES